MAVYSFDGQDSKNIYYLDAAARDKLNIAYNEVVDMIQAEAVSSRLKNQDITGDIIPNGSVRARRLKTSVVKAYGTARAAAAGDKVADNGVEVLLDQMKEIVEEMELNDVQRYGVSDLLGKRKTNQVKAVVRHLDDAFFVAAQTAATIVTTTDKSTLVDKLEKLILTLETLSNTNVDGVDRSMMVLTLHPTWYAALRTYIDTLPNPANGGVNINLFHGVEVVSAVRQDVDAMVMVKGAVAQPAALTEYNVEKIPLSNAVAVETFLVYGTKAVMPDCIFKTGLDAGGDISA